MKKFSKPAQNKKQEVLRNIPAFIRAYLKGKNGQELLARNKPFAVAFAKAINHTQPTTQMAA
jgi:hypothetical protein